MHLNKPYVIGLDGGGTSTKLVLGDFEGNILEFIEIASTNLKSNPEAVVKTLLQGAIQKLLMKVNASPSDVAHVFLALAGGDRVEDQVRWEQWVRQVLPDTQITVRNDAVAALISGTYAFEGAVLIAGTGSICYRISESGQHIERVGGWGYLFGDEGSGFAIGTAALRLVMQGHDRREQRDMDFEKALLSYCELSSPDELITYVYENDYPRALISSLASPILELAAAGNATAEQIVDEAIHALVQLVDALTKKNQQQVEELVLTGGLFRSAHFRKKIIEMFRLHFTEMKLVEPAFPPVVGAYVGSLLESGKAIDDDIKKALDRTWQACVGEEGLTWKS